MSQYTIAVAVGSLRRDSLNRKVAIGVTRLAPPDFSSKQLEIGDLPLYNQDDDANPTEPVKRVKADIAFAQGLMFVTAEYNRPIPGVLKNAIDQASRPYGKNAWAGKPEGVLGASVGALGTAVAQQHLRTPSSRIWMCPHSANPKPSSRPRTASWTKPATSVPATRSFFRPGWTGMSPG